MAKAVIMDSFVDNTVAARQEIPKKRVKQVRGPKSFARASR